MVHIFAYVVRSIHDPFLGIKKSLLADGGDRICELRFSDEEFDLVDQVEYTERRFFRFFYCQKIFRRLLETLDDALAAAGDEPTTVYFSDEGVWAVLWSAYRDKCDHRNLRAVNVQHGFALLRRARFQGLRRFVNAVSRLATGLPCVGYGSLGGVGPTAFDLYLTYDSGTAQFVTEATGCRALAVPRLIKHELIEAFFAMPRLETDQCLVLFAMNINMRGSPVKCDAVQTFDVLLPLAKSLSDLGARLIVRLHPGMDRTREIERFHVHPLADFADIDLNARQHESLAKSRVVMSFVSTVLWEAGLLGLLPVQLVCRCCEYVEMSYEREILTIGENMRGQLVDLIGRARQIENLDWRESEAREWLLLKPHLQLREVVASTA